MADETTPTHRLDELLADEATWPTVRALIKSEQIPPDRIAEIYREHPEFAQWMLGIG